MVSFWPFGREDANSPKSFEKRLAELSDKIQRLQIRGDTLSATHRRVKVLFTLYGTFIYLVAFLILTLVTGYQKWRTAEWTAVAGSPVAIVAVRYVLDLYFDWREGNVRTRLEKTKERDAVIKKLKDAMRYDSTKELLDKYGGSGGKGSPAKQKDAQAKKTGQKNQMPQRTGFAPPPTANIPGRNPPVQNALDAKLRNVSAPIQNMQSALQFPVDDRLAPGESFAPNAYSDSDRPPTSRPASNHVQPARPGLLDRVLDLIVGEDESARNRIVLLCSSCKLVNGQAPPGTRSLAELGRWKCSACGAWNGVESNSDKIIEQAKADVAAEEREPMSAISAPAAIGDTSMDDSGDSD